MEIWIIDHIECRYIEYGASQYLYFSVHSWRMDAEGFISIQIFSMMVSFFNPVNAFSEETSMVAGCISFLGE